jgi:hypothetical protein
MARVAYDDSTDEAHIAVGLALAPREALCGVRAVECAEHLSRYRAEWPALEFEWCEACVKAFAPV